MGEGDVLRVLTYERTIPYDGGFLFFERKQIEMEIKLIIFF
jgi:hypothetical protein